MRNAALRKPNPDHRKMTWREPIKVQAPRLSGAGNVVQFRRSSVTRKPTDDEAYAKAINRQRVRYFRENHKYLWGIWVNLKTIGEVLEQGNTDSAIRLTEHAKELMHKQASIMLGLEEE